MADKSYIKNVNDLDQIIFYTGTYSIDAASYVANREYGSTVEGLGTLSYNSNYEIYYDKYPNVKYTEKNTDLRNLNDLFENTLSYLYTFDEDFSIGTTYAARNRYNAIYMYETDLGGALDDTAEYFISSDLNKFLVGLNTQVFNKQRFYGDRFEVSSIKIDNTYYNWYQKDTVAYVDPHVETVTVLDLSEVRLNRITTNIYEGNGEVNTEVVDVVLTTLYSLIPDLPAGDNKIVSLEGLVEYFKAKEIADEVPEDERIWQDFTFDKKVVTLLAQLKEQGLLADDYYFHIIETERQVDVEHPEEYIIGNDYYSYVRNVYYPIGDTLKEKIHDKLEKYKTEVCGGDENIYAYYIYQCDANLEMLLSTLNFGDKQSTFLIGFDSEFNKWFDNKIDINASASAGDTLLNITSCANDKIFNVILNNSERICGDNKVVEDKNNKVSFITNTDIALGDTINILTPGSIEGLDLSPIKTKLGSVLNLISSDWYKDELNLKTFILDNGDNEKSTVNKILGLNVLNTLEYIDISNTDNLKVTPAIDKLENLKVFKSFGSSIDSFRPKKGISMYDVELSDSVKSIKLDTISFIPGSLKVMEDIVNFTGTFNYTPNTNLNSLTLRNIDDEISYKLVTDWYDILEANDLLDTVIYLELKGINWDNVPVKRMVDIKHFDINPNLSGTVKLIGTGNYKWLTRKEYQQIINLYGINAFTDATVRNRKTFKDLVIDKKSKIETFEYSLTVESLDIEDVKFNKILEVKLNQYQSNGQVYPGVPYYNRAANSFLDIVDEKAASSENYFVFRKAELGDYVYCSLDRSIDTSSSVEISRIKAGDILLLNGDTLVIYYGDVNNNLREYVKIGEITDEFVTERAEMVSVIARWFENNAETRIQFTPSERETVIQELTLTALSADENTIYNTNHDGINIAIDIDAFALEHLDDINITDIEFEPNDNLIITEVGEENRDGHYRLYNIKAAESFNFDILTTTTVSFWCPAEKNETIVNYEITLRKAYNPSYVEDEILVLDGETYSVEDETLIINTDRINASFENNILTID